MLTPGYHALDGDSGVLTRRRVILGLGAAFVVAAIVVMTQTEVSNAASRVLLCPLPQGEANRPPLDSTKKLE